MKIKALRPLLPASNDIAIKLTCPPYDVVSQQEAAKYIEKNPDSFMSVVRSDALFPHLSPYHDSVYDASLQAFKRLQQQALLLPDQQSTLYVYQQQMATHSQCGLVTLVNVHDYDNNVILKHENTRPDKEQDRTRLTDTLSANTGPVFLTYRDVPSIDHIITESMSETPLFHLSAEDNVTHNIWRVSQQHVPTLLSLFETKVPKAYIADGHHRSASAARVATTRIQKAASNYTAQEPFNWFLAVLFPQTHLKIMAYHRVVTDLNGLDEQHLIKKLNQIGHCHPISTPQHIPAQARIVFVYLKNKWYKLELPEQNAQSTTSVSESLDCSVLQRMVLGPILGVTDARNSKRIEFVGGIRGLTFLQKRADELNGIAFAMHPVRVEQLMHVSDQGQIMPPKCTWFEPKLRSGFFVHTF